MCHRYIHWWIQLMHEADREQFPNLFDVVASARLHLLGVLLVGS